MTATAYNVTLEEAIDLVSAAECAENGPDFAEMDTGDLIDLVRNQLGVDNTEKIDGWLAINIVDGHLGAAYKAVLCATESELDAAMPG